MAGQTNRDANAPNTIKRVRTGFTNWISTLNMSRGEREQVKAAKIADIERENALNNIRADPADQDVIVANIVPLISAEEEDQGYIRTAVLNAQSELHSQYRAFHRARNQYLARHPNSPRIPTAEQYGLESPTLELPRKHEDHLDHLNRLLEQLAAQCHENGAFEWLRADLKTAKETLERHHEMMAELWRDNPQATWTVDEAVWAYDRAGRYRRCAEAFVADQPLPAFTLDLL